MKRQSFILLFCALWGLIFSAPALAQFQEQCATPAEQAITTVFNPNFGARYVWDTVHPERGYDVEIKATFPVGKTDNLTIGHMSDKKSGQRKILLGIVNQRGYMADKKEFDAQKDEHVVQAIPVKSHFLLLTAIKSSAGQRGYGFLQADEALTLTKRKHVFESGWNYEPKGITYDQATNRLYVSGQRTPLRGSGQGIGFIAAYNMSGQKLWERRYTPGSATSINGVIVTERHLLAYGSVQGAGGASGGWVLQLQKNGSIDWQKSYAYGAEGKFLKATPMGQGYLLVGEIMPADDTGRMALWVAAQDAFGNIRWHRFIRARNYSFAFQDVLPSEFGPITILANASGKNREHRNHARLLTISPYANVIRDESHIRGAESRAFSFFEGHFGRRMMSGVFIPDDEPGQGSASEGWIIAGSGLDPYRDPCTRSNNVRN